jgi:hydroxymethylbilane synthase
MQKVMDKAELDATVLALAGIMRLNFKIAPEGKLLGDAVPAGLLATVLDLDVMLPCVGQGAIGIEVRADDERIKEICARLDHYDTHQCVTAERAFLAARGGGCQSPVGAYAEVAGKQLQMRVVSFMHDTVRRAEARRPIKEATELGRQIAAELEG